jgi:hypothetical protein
MFATAEYKANFPNSSSRFRSLQRYHSMLNNVSSSLLLTAPAKLFLLPTLPKPPLLYLACGT